MKKLKQKPEKLNLQSMSITEEQKKKLRQLFPEVFNENKIDWERLKATLGEDLDKSPERYHISWPGKADCFSIIQKSSLGALKPCKEESLDWDKTQNLFIEGDNLEVLKLLQQSYYGKVKMIYIDPPYNTGKDFIYPDKYSDNLETYLKYTEQKDAQGKKFSTNQETDGRFHSKWINMMYPRLFLARNLLRDDGVIFISIDDNEVTNLRKICDEIFGEENFIANIIWRKKTGAQDSITLATVTEYILVYVKNTNFLESIFSRNMKSYDIDRYKLSDEHIKSRGKYYIDNLDRGSLRYSDSLNFPIICPDGKITYPNGRREFTKEGWTWIYGKEKVKWAIENDFIEFRKSNTKESGWSVCYKNYMYVNNKGESEEKSAPHKNLIVDILNTDSAKDIKDIFQKNIFKYSKPYKLIKKFISFLNIDEEQIILDFFAGSGTTAHAVYEKNLEDGGSRKYICVQIPEPTQENTEAYKAGYKNIADIGKERIRRAVKKMKEENKQQDLLNEGKNNLDLGFRVFKLDKSNFKIWDERISKDKDSSEQIKMHLEELIDKKSNDEDLLYEILIKTGYPLTTKIKTLNREGKIIYSIEDNALVICLEKQITKELIKELAKLKPARVVCLDTGFEGNDHLKTNAFETFKSYGVNDFKTV